jgi:putative ABC transport system substrate-binding protein
MHELMPGAATIAYLMNPTNPTGKTEMETAQAAAHSLGKKLHVFTASNESEIDAAFAAMAQPRVGALLVAADAFFFWQRNQLVSLAARNGIPAIYYLCEFAAAGGLMTYGSDLPDAFRLVDVYVGRSQRRKASRPAGPAIDKV